MATEASTVVSTAGSDEEQLLAGCRRGERDAQARLFEIHHAAVYRALLAQCGDPSEAEDLVQETFLRAYRAIVGFRGHSSVRTWLMRIATNALYETRRREQARLERLRQWHAGQGPAPLQLVPESTPRPARAHELRDLILRGLAHLKLADRTVVALHDVEGYSYSEIAEILDIAPGTVGSRLSRARLRLADAVRELLRLGPEEKLRVEHLYGEGSSRMGHRLPTRPRDEQT